MDSNLIEIYKQRYETFRHLDKLRWQMLQIALAIGAVTVSFSRGRDDTTTALSLAFCGSAIILLCFAMERIGTAIRANGAVLAESGAAVGDVDIMKPGGRLVSSAFWIAVAVAAFGTFLLFEGVSILLSSRDA